MNVHHFNKVGCKIHHMSITVLEKVKTNNTLPYRLARKAFYVEKFRKYRKYRRLIRNANRSFLTIYTVFVCNVYLLN